MRHRKSFNHLGRTSAHRKAMLANMANSLILHKRIKTTTAKAKALRMYIEPLITKSKEDTTHSRRVVFGYLKNKYAVTELFREVSTKIADRPGGYTRILKIGNRPGDNADMCIIELVDYNENMLETVKETKARTTRRGRRGKKKSAATATEKTSQGIPAEDEEKQTPEESTPPEIEGITDEVKEPENNNQDKEENTPDNTEEDNAAERK